MSIGVCYFPEHWPSERWETDVAQMADAGLEYVRMAEFSWAVLEPSRGEFEVDWLEEAVELIGEHGMQAVLCTPTATPPKWLVDDHPEILQEERDGTVRNFGSRRHYCFNSPVYREETERIVGRLADHFADDPHVVGWQTDNEFGCHDTVRCYCDDCANAFRDWLRERYDSIDALNEAWGNTFWSQRYSSFGEIDPPRHTPAEHHPSRLLEYYRFANESVVDYNRLHATLLRERNDDWFVTHNFMGRFDSLDAYSVSEDLDLVSWDSYPTGFVQDRLEAGGDPTPDQLRAGDPDQVGMDHDLYRGALDRPFWVMEQQPGDVNWPPHCPQPGEGAMRLWAHHATAHGADAVLYFRWRRCLEGQEQYHAGLRKQDGSPDRGYEDAVTVADELANLPETGTEREDVGGRPALDHVDAPIALLHDYDDLWALSEQPHAPDFEYWNLLGAFYTACRARGVQVDVIHPSRDLSSYEAVIAPALHLVTDELADRLTAYVEGGGELLFGPRTGVKDEYNKLRPVQQPGPLTDLVGASVDQHESLPDHLETRVRSLEDGNEYAFRTWAEWLEADAAEPLFAYGGDDVAADRPAVVRNSAGEGSVVYCGVWPEADLADAVIGPLLDRAEIETSERLPEGVRVAARGGYTWVTNFSSDEVRVTSPDGNLSAVVGSTTVGPFDVAVLEGHVVDGLSVLLES
ncbi:beta-galactosidase [Saliphagus sp. GCM10025334]